jgi:hypothetical protein
MVLLSIKLYSGVKVVCRPTNVQRHPRRLDIAVVRCEVMPSEWSMWLCEYCGEDECDQAGKTMWMRVPAYTPVSHLLDASQGAARGNGRKQNPRR